MTTLVRDILDRIVHLPAPERAELQSQLSRMEEDEWLHLLEEARRSAQERGIDDAVVARAVESVRTVMMPPRDENPLRPTSLGDASLRRDPHSVDARLRGRIACGGHFKSLSTVQDRKHPSRESWMRQMKGQPQIFTDLGC